MKTVCSVLTVLFFVLMIFIPFADAEVKYIGDIKETLYGLTGVDVLVEELSPDIEKDGLKSEQIKTDVELKLRIAGIKVLTSDELLITPGAPWLYIRANSIKIDSAGLYSFTVEVSLKQDVYLSKNYDTSGDLVKTTVTTWNDVKIGSIGITKVNQIRDFIKDSVDKFCNDYLTVNPK